MSSPAGVEFRSLGDVGEFVRGSGLQKRDLTDSGVGAIHYGQVFTTYGTFTTETRSCVDAGLAARLKRAKPGDLVVATTSENDEDVCKAVAWLGDTEIAISGDAYAYSHDLDPLFMAFVFQTEGFQSQKRRFVTGTKMKRVSGSDLARIRIPVPPMEVQRHVSSVLAEMERLTAELEHQLRTERAYRARQYDFHRDSLLDLAGEDGVRRAPLGELFEMRAGRFIAAAEIADAPDAERPYPCFGGGGLRGYVARSSHEGDRVLIGRQGALCGNVKRATGRFYATEHAVVVTPRPEVDIRWAFHVLTAMDLNQHASKSAQPGLAVGTIQKLEIPVPAPEEQRRVGAILDRLDSTASDLSLGLSREVEARRQQYEHYRESLLTFEEVA